jgi:hypothetical protein
MDAKNPFFVSYHQIRGMSVKNGSSSIFSMFLLATLISIAAQAQGSGEDPIGFKGGYKALRRLCETNLEGASRLLTNNYSRGYFVSLAVPEGADTITNITFLTAASPELAREMTLALKGTNGNWLKRDQARTLLIPIFFCQNTPPNDSLFAQLLVANNAGSNVPGFPDQWPEATEGIWLHPVCPLVPGRAPRAPTQNATSSATATTSATAVAPVQQTAPQPSSPSVAVPDSTMSSGIYLTEADFDAGRMTWPIMSPIEEKSLISWSNVDYATRTNTVRVRTSATARDYKEFSNGSIFGFRSNNVKYIYLKSAKQYIAVVYKGTPFSLFMSLQKQTGIGDGTTYGVFQFAKTIDSPLKEFTRKKIDEEFGSNPTMAADLQLLRKELDKRSMNLSPATFQSCKQLVKETLAKYAN